MRPSGYCYWHDPTLAEERGANRTRGGKGRSNAARAKQDLLLVGAMTAEEVLAYLGLSLKRVLSGRLEPGKAAAVATLARVWLSGRQTLLSEDIERRLAELEAATKEGMA